MSYRGKGAVFGQDGSEIDLYNFEDEKYALEDYVLTSPRSLEACRRLLIKPAELLYKPLAAFQTELADGGSSLRAMYEKYDLHEQERQNKLRACRLERENITTQHSKTRWLDSFGNDLRVTTGANAGETKKMEPGLWENGSTTAFSSGAAFSRFEGSVLLNDSGSLLSSAAKAAQSCPASSNDSGVLQSSSSVLHRRSSPSLRRATSPIDHDDSLSRSLSCMDLYSRKDKHRHGGGVTSRSLSSAVSPDRQPTKITSTSLRRVLALPDDMEVTRKDQKILEAMLAKKQADQQLEQTRSAAELSWDEERQQLLGKMAAADTERWRMLAVKQREHELEQAAEQERRRSEEAAWRRQQEEQAFVNELTADQRVSKVRESMSQQIEAKKQRDHERKSRQEEALSMLDQQLWYYRSSVMSKSMQDLNSASSKREDHITYETKKKKRQSRRRSSSHQARHSAMGRLHECNLEDLRRSIAQKHIRGQRNYDSILSSRDFRIEMKRKERSKKRAKSQERLERMNQTMEAHNRELLKHSYYAEAKAADAAQSSIEARARHVRRSREAKEKLHKSLYESIQQEHDALRWQHASHSAVKEWKAKAVQHEKETENYKLRSMAATAQKLREDLKKQYGGDTFDKKVKEVELQSRVGYGIRSAARNASTVVLA